MLCIEYSSNSIYALFPCVNTEIPNLAQLFPCGYRITGGFTALGPVATGLRVCAFCHRTLLRYNKKHYKGLDMDMLTPYVCADRLLQEASAWLLDSIAEDGPEYRGAVEDAREGATGELERAEAILHEAGYESIARDVDPDHGHVVLDYVLRDARAAEAHGRVKALRLALVCPEARTREGATALALQLRNLLSTGFAAELERDRELDKMLAAFDQGE
jgi:hypothetical protein